MRWEDEPYVRLYQTETPDMTLWCWQAHALHPNLLKKLDRAGILDLGRAGYRGIANLVKLPLDVVTAAMDGTSEGVGLLEDGCVELTGSKLVMPNYIEAQTARRSDLARKRDERERARAVARQAEAAPPAADAGPLMASGPCPPPGGLAAPPPALDPAGSEVASGEGVAPPVESPPNTPVPTASQPVTKRDKPLAALQSGHEPSHGDTGGHSEQFSAVPGSTEKSENPRARVEGLHVLAQREREAEGAFAALHERAKAVSKLWHAIPGAPPLPNAVALMPIAEALDGARELQPAATPPDAEVLAAMCRIAKRRQADGLHDVFRPKTLAATITLAIQVASGEVDLEKRPHRNGTGPATTPASKSRVLPLSIEEQMRRSKPGG